MSSQVFTRRDGAEQSIKVMDASSASKSGGHDETVPTLHGYPRDVVSQRKE